MTCPEVRGLLAVEVKPAAKLVLLAFALRAGADGRAWPSVTRLSGDTGLSPRAVRYAIGTLTDAGYITVERRPGRASIVSVTPAPPARVPLQDVHPPLHLTTKTPAPRAPRSSNEGIKEVATTGSTPPVPAVAWNGNGNTPAAVPPPTAHPPECICGGTGEIRLEFGTFECGGGVL